MLAMALSGYSGRKRSLWRKTCEAAAGDLQHPYLRAVFDFLTAEPEDNYNKVLVRVAGWADFCISALCCAVFIMGSVGKLFQGAGKPQGSVTYCRARNSYQTSAGCLVSTSTSRLYHDVVFFFIYPAREGGTPGPCERSERLRC